MAEELNREGYQHTYALKGGFDAWRDKANRTHRGFRDLVLADYPPDKVARITGVPVETIERLAHEMAAVQVRVVMREPVRDDIDQA